MGDQTSEPVENTDHNFFSGDFNFLVFCQDWNPLCAYPACSNFNPLLIFFSRETETQIPGIENSRAENPADCICMGGCNCISTRFANGWIYRSFECNAAFYWAFNIYFCRCHSLWYPRYGIRFISVYKDNSNCVREKQCLENLKYFVVAIFIHCRIPLPAC